MQGAVKSGGISQFMFHRRVLYVEQTLINAFVNLFA